MDRGTFQEIEGHPSVRFERVYQHRIERVWAAITEPDQLRHWFPSEVHFEPRTGGAIRFTGDPNMSQATGTVLVWQPPARFAFTWGGDELHFFLEPRGDHHCRLTLINQLDERNTAARNASGWTVCLAEMDKLIAGSPGDGPHSATTLPFGPIYEDYVAAGMPHGAFIPGDDVHNNASQTENA